MGVIVPADEISIEDIKVIREQVKNVLLDMVSKKTNKPRSDLVVRDILPLTDLGLGTEEWDTETNQVSGSWTKDWTHELDEDQAVAFYGIELQDETCNLIGIRFKLGSTGGTTLAVYHLQRIIKEGQEESDKKSKGYFSPIYYGGKESPYVEYYARANVTAAAAHVVLIGMFCEPKGEVVS